MVVNSFALVADLCAGLRFVGLAYLLHLLLDTMSLSRASVMSTQLAFVKMAVQAEPGEKTRM